MSVPRKKHRVLNVLFLVFVILVAVWLVLSSAYLLLRTVAANEERLPELFGYWISTEMTDQMEEVIPKGSVVLAVEKMTPAVNDIVLYRDGEGFESGRISEILSFGSSPTYEVTYDAKEGVAEEIVYDNIYGKVVYAIPLLGYLVNYLNTFNGMLFAVLVPGVCLIILLIIRMVFSIRASRQDEDEDYLLEDEEEINAVTVRETVSFPARNEELDGLWQRNRPAGSSRADEILTDQDMVHQLSNMNNAFANDPGATQEIAEEKALEAEQIVSEIFASKVSEEPVEVVTAVVEETVSKTDDVSDYDQLIEALGLKNNDSFDLISMLRQYGVTDEAAVDSVQKAAPFVKPVITENGVDLNLENRPVQKIRVMSDEYGKFLIVETDQVETKIKLPF